MLIFHRLVLLAGIKGSFCAEKTATHSGNLPADDNFIFRGTYSCIKPWYSPRCPECSPFSQHSSFPVSLIDRGKKRQPYAALAPPAYKRAALGGGSALGVRVLMSFGVGCQSSVHTVTKTLQPSQHNKQWCFSWKYLSFFPALEKWVTYDFVPKLGRWH